MENGKVGVRLESRAGIIRRRRDRRGGHERSSSEAAIAPFWYPPD